MLASICVLKEKTPRMMSYANLCYMLHTEDN